METDTGVSAASGVTAGIPHKKAPHERRARLWRIFGGIQWYQPLELPAGCDYLMLNAEHREVEAPL